MGLVFFFTNTMEVNGVHPLLGYLYSSKYLLLCSTEEINSYRFGNYMDSYRFTFLGELTL